jgi:hypothetical protein
LLSVKSQNHITVNELGGNQKLKIYITINVKWKSGSKNTYVLTYASSSK